MKETKEKSKALSLAIEKLEKTYGHLDTEIAAADLIKGQGYDSRSVVLMETENSPE